MFRAPILIYLIKAPFLIIWFNCECRIGGSREKTRTLELDDIEKNKNAIVTNTECRLQKQKPQPPQKTKFKCSDWQHKETFSSDVYQGSLNAPRKLCQRV